MSTPDPYTDPNELFDVYDGAGQPTGRVKRRADVHRDGDWHRAFHCWVTCEETPTPELILQRRGLQKDTWPGRLDVTVGGHFSAGEMLDDVVREVEEEIGQAVRLGQLVSLGRRVAVSEREEGVRDRELQDVFLWRSPLPLAAYRPQPIEVVALEAVPVAALLDLFEGKAASAACRRLLPDGSMEQATLGVDDLIPCLDQYYHRMAAIADLALCGYPHLVV
jgi:isopentenyldiphosphate isomerase